MKNIFKISLFIFTTLIVNQLSAQSSYVELQNNVYTFLSDMSQKGIVDYHDLVKPLSRQYIAKKLIETRKNYEKLTSLQKDELKFYEEEFGYEIEKQNPEVRSQKSAEVKDGEGIKETAVEEKQKRDLYDNSWEFEVRNSGENNEINQSGNSKEKYTFFEKDLYQRWHFFGYRNKFMQLNVDPVLGVELGNWENKNYKNLTGGVKFYGEFGDIVGYNFELKDTRQTPGNISFLYNDFSQQTSIDIFLKDNKRLEYSTIDLNIGYRWKWGELSIGKNFLNWGYAERGQIVLSEKAPSFPFIMLKINPAEWMSFFYLHGWLNSDVIDTSSYYATWRVRNDKVIDHYNYIQKYLALHSLTFFPIKGLECSIGESIIYSDKLQLGYLIPIMFFDMMDNYLSRSENYAGGSTQLFLAVSSRNHIPNTHMYGIFHADELTPDSLFDPKGQYYKMAFTLGANVIDLPVENLGFTIEYTKVYPGEYRHFTPSLNYKSSSALMGHWIGDNGDLFYLSFDYTVLRGLKFNIWTQYIRKGTEALGNRAYKIQIPQPGFLFTDNIRDRKNYRYYGINAEYEIFHDLWIKAHFQYINYEQKVSEDKYKSALNRDFSLILGYGI